jgi:hypothetical protein
MDQIRSQSAIDESVEFSQVQKDFDLCETMKKVEVRKIGDPVNLNVSPELFLINMG